jgi:Protein of unknown function (DUF3237)
VTLRPPTPPPVLERAFDLEIALAAPLDLGRSSAGAHWFIEIAGGRVTGPRLSGEILPGGGDWAVDRGDGTWQLDARYAVRLDDGTPVEVRNHGFYVEGAGGPRYYLTTPSFRVGTADDGPHGWLARAVFVGEAFEIDPLHIRIEVHVVGHAGRSPA